MAEIRSNRPAVVRALAGLSRAFNLRRRPYGGKKRLGDELLDAVAGAIVDRSVAKQQDPSGNPWAKLRPRTIARKRRLGLDLRINIETHEMLDFEQVRGRTVVTSDVASMSAGLDAEMQQKAEYAHEGGPNRPERPFYEPGKEGTLAVDVLADETIAGAVREAEAV